MRRLVLHSNKIFTKKLHFESCVWPLRQHIYAVETVNAVNGVRILRFQCQSRIRLTHRFCQQLNEQLLSKCFISNLRFKPSICIFTIVPKKCVRAWFVGLLFLPCLQAHQLPLRPVGKPVRLKHTVDIMFRLQFLLNLWLLHFIYPESLWIFMLKKTVVFCRFG